MNAAVRLEADVWGNRKFDALARELGMPGGNLQAIAAVAQIWSWQTEHYTPETPTYVVPADVVAIYLGPDGPRALVKVRLAEERPEGLFMKKSIGRIEWLWKHRQKSRKGGRKSGDARRATDIESGSDDHEIEPVVQAQVNHQVDLGLTPTQAYKLQAKDYNTDSQTKVARRATRVAVPGLTEVRDEFHRRFMAKTGHAPTWNAVAISMLKGLLRAHAQAEVIRRMAIMFDGHGPRWMTTFDLKSFVANIDKLAAPATQTGRPSSAVGRFEPLPADQYPDGDQKL